MTVAYFSLVAFCLIGFLLTLTNSGGNFLILFGLTLFTFLTDFQIFSWKWLAGFFLLAGVGELGDLLFSSFAVKALGGSKRAIWGSFLGGAVGSLLGLILGGIGIIPGFLMGLLGGSFIAEFTMNYDFKKSIQASCAAFLGLGASVLFKVLIALTLLVLIASRLIDRVSV